MLLDRFLIMKTLLISLPGTVTQNNDPNQNDDEEDGDQDSHLKSVSLDDEDLHKLGKLDMRMTQSINWKMDKLIENVIAEAEEEGEEDVVWWLSGCVCCVRACARAHCFNLITLPCQKIWRISPFSSALDSLLLSYSSPAVQKYSTSEPPDPLRQQ